MKTLSSSSVALACVASVLLSGLHTVRASLPDIEVEAHKVKIWNLVGPCQVDSDIPGEGELQCASITNPIVSAAISASCQRTHILWQSLGGCPNIAAVSAH